MHFACNHPNLEALCLHVQLGLLVFCSVTGRRVTYKLTLFEVFGVASTVRAIFGHRC
jgi:hypothetical protein